MRQRIVSLLSIIILFFLTTCGDSGENLPNDVTGSWDGEVWAFRQLFGENVLSNQTGTFEGTLDLNPDLTFSFEDSDNVVDGIFDTFEFPENGTYEVLGSTINGSIVFSPDGSDEILLELFRTDSSITLTYKEEVMRNGGVNDIEIDLFFLEAN